MKELKITKGDFSVNEKEVENIGGEYSAKVRVRSEDINELHAKAFGWSKDEALANAELINETFTVANECGLTPKQLLEQRDEFHEVCRLLLTCKSDADFQSVQRMAKEAIENCEPTSQG